MGKSLAEAPPPRRKTKVSGGGTTTDGTPLGCQTPTAPLCVCCTSSASLPSDSALKTTPTLAAAVEFQQGAVAETNPPVKDLVVVGAGPHALALALRLLEPEADLLSDKERHLCADYFHRMRPISQVRKHIQDLSRGPKAVLKKKPVSKKNRKGNMENRDACSDPPSVSLDFFREHCVVVDDNGSKGWMAGWKEKFAALKIEQLRSPISAHCDPYDHRGLEFYAEGKNRNDELVGLDHMPKSNSRWDFHGPYNAPSTSLFNDFHDQLAQSYGIKDVVKEGKVVDVHLRVPSSNEEEPIFLLSVKDATGVVSVLRTRRVVCALGPAIPQNIATLALSWEPPLRTRLEEMKVRYCDRVLHGHQIFDWISERENTSIQKKDQNSLQSKRILIVGGGVTSAHLALVAASTDGVSSVTFIQRSPIKERQFDIVSSWMGPARGKLQEEFQLLSPAGRVKMIRDARGGGSIPPEVVVQLLTKKDACRKRRKRGQEFMMKDCVEVDDVQLLPDRSLEAFLNDGTCWKGDMIWLATGFANQIENHELLHKLCLSLPIQTEAGLPVLNSDLSWGTDDNEAERVPWKQVARNRFWVMGALAALELGPDALNLMGARQGAVRVARAIRLSMVQ